MSDLKQIFGDLNAEFHGQILEETFQIGNVSFKMRLLNSSERTWAYSFITGATSGIGTALQVQNPILAIGIREINGKSVFSFFEKEFKDLDENTQKDILDAKDGTQYFGASMLHDFLAEETPEIVDELSAKWRELEERKKKASDSIKK